MKKILSILTASILILCFISGCTNKLKQASLDAIAESYSSNTYEEKQQKEIDELVAEYTQKIENAKTAEEIKQLETDAIEEIQNIYTKEKIDSIKAYAEKTLELPKGKILPYQQVRELLPKVQELLATDHYSDLEAAANELNELISGVSEKATYEAINNGVTFSFEVTYSEENGLPILSYSFSDDVKNCGVKQSSQKLFAISMSSICHSSVLNPTVDKMASYMSFGCNDSVVVYCGEDSSRMYENAPELARCQIDGNTYKFTVFTDEQKAALNSKSSEFINSDGITTQRDSGDESPLNYITILVSHPTSKKGSNFAERLTWIVIL